MYSQSFAEVDNVCLGCTSIARKLQGRGRGTGQTAHADACYCELAGEDADKSTVPRGGRRELVRKMATSIRTTSECGRARESLSAPKRVAPPSPH